MKKNIEFPEIVLEVLKELKDKNDVYLPLMEKLTNDKDDFKKMWRHILRTKRQGECSEMEDKAFIHLFLGAVEDSAKKEAPVYYLNGTQRKDYIDKIRAYEKKLQGVYKTVFAEDAQPHVNALLKNTSKAIKEIETCYVIAKGDKKTREILSFVQEMAQRNVWFFEKELPSVIRATVLAVYNYSYNSDVNITKLLKHRTDSFYN